MDMIDRYKKWSLTHTNESDSDSDASNSNNGGDDNSGQDDSDWNLTVKGVYKGQIPLERQPFIIS